MDRDHQMKSEGVDELLPYSAPVLIYLGDVRNQTLGGSRGRGDSGSPSTQRTLGPRL
jgi:hypothetical protein